MEKRIKDLICLLIKDKQKLKMVALPVIVGVAILFFWFNGNQDPIEVASAEANLNIQNENPSNENATSSLIYVDISGEVNLPGVYEVKEGTRLFQVIDMAGGLTKEANIDSLNRAEEVYDGEKIIVGDNNYSESNQNNYSSGISNDGRVNINIANLSELETLPNIGPAKAQNIIDYRESNGKFQSIDDILNVNGIGSKTFDSLKDLICV